MSLARSAPVYTMQNIDEDPEVQSQIARVRDESHPSLIEFYIKLTEQRQDELRGADLLKKYQQEAIKKIYATEFKAMHTENKKSKAELRKSMIADLEIAKEKCKEWFTNIKIDGSEDDVRETRQTRQKRKLDAVEVKAEKAPKASVVRDPASAGPTVQYEVKDSERDADLLLLNDTRSGSKKRLTVSTKDHSSGQSVECFYEHKPADRVNGKYREATDRLWYDGKWYMRGCKVTVEYPDKEKQTGHIMMFTAADIWVRRGEQHMFTKFALRISELASKKYTMRLAQGREQ